VLPVTLQQQKASTSSAMQATVSSQVQPSNDDGSQQQ